MVLKETDSVRCLFSTKLFCHISTWQWAEGTEFGLCEGPVDLSSTGEKKSNRCEGKTTPLNFSHKMLLVSGRILIRGSTTAATPIPHEELNSRETENSKCGSVVAISITLGLKEKEIKPYLQNPRFVKIFC